MSRPENVGFTHDELRALYAALRTAIPDSFTVRTQVTQRTCTVTFRWDDKRPVIGPASSAQFAEVIGQPQAPLQLVAQLLDLIDGTS